MTLTIKPICIAAISALTLALPLPLAAASLSPLDTDPAFSGALPATDNAAQISGKADGKPDFEFVGGDVLTGDPLRDILPEDQWANPQAATANRLLQRR